MKKIERLKRETRLLSTSLGHSLSKFHHLPGAKNSAIAHCTVCAHFVTVVAYPQVNETEVFGTVVAGWCPKNEGWK